MPDLETVCLRQLRLLDAREVANLLGIKEKTLEKWRADGTGPPHLKIGRKLTRYDPADLILWMKEHRAPGLPAPTSEGRHD